MIKKIKIVIIVIVVFYLTPFLGILIGKANLENMLFVVISSEIRAKSINETEIIKNSFTFISSKINKPDTDILASHMGPFEILISEKGYCDEQAEVLKTVLNFSNINSEIIFLNGKNSKSKHSALILSNSKIVLDPFYDQLIYNKSNQLATYQDIKSGNILLNKKLPDNYLDHFQGKYKYTEFKTEKVSFFESCKKKHIKVWYSIFGYTNFKMYLKFGKLLGSFSEKTINQINKILPK